VVLVHGLGLNQHMWQWQVPALEDRYRVIRYDLLGHGASEAPADPCTMEMMVQQLAELMQHLQLKPCALLGFSLGGLIVQAFTLAHPERIAALGVLHAAHGRTDEQRAAIMLRVEQSRESGPAATITAALERWFSGEFASRNPEVPEQVRQWVTANDPQVYPNLYRLLAIADIGLEESIRAITCPTLVMTAEEDYGNSPAMSERIAARIQGAQLEILPALRHMALAEDPDTCNRLIGNFLEEHIKAR
jgi:pimeloyl-ACP methyl ester carboxylesterase